MISLSAWPVAIPRPRQPSEPKTPVGRPAPDSPRPVPPSRAQVYACRAFAFGLLAGGWVHLWWWLVAAAILRAVWELQDRHERAQRRWERHQLSAAAHRYNNKAT